MGFDPSQTASAKLGLFGLPVDRERAAIHLLQIPWEVTTSYGGGTALGPRAILAASPQIDLFDLELGKAYEAGYYLLPEPHHLMDLNQRLRPLALEIRQGLEENGELDRQLQIKLDEVNRGCDEMVTSVYWTALDTLKTGKLLGLIGGDHSTPEGAIRAQSEYQGNNFGILHIDAHADLRRAYQGFKHSHASIMNNVMTAEWRPKKLVQVGIRDFCQEEYDMIRARPDIKTFFDVELQRALLSGTPWSELVKQIVSELPDRVYVSFDIDGLQPIFCPHTGTPVPGGLSFDQATYLMRAVTDSGRRLIGFDLNEVAPGSEGDEWDGNVGARILFKLCGWLAKSQGRA